MRVKQKQHSIDSLFTFLLLLVFAVFTLVLVVIGSAIYQNGIKHLNENYTSRTAIAYVTEKVRQHDSSHSVFLTEVEDTPAIAFRDMVEDNSCITYVYYYNGSLRELFVREETVPRADMGTEIVVLSSFSVSDISQKNPSSGSDTNPSLLRVSAGDEEGRVLSVLIHCVSQEA